MESEALHAKRKAKPTIEFRGFPFYRETLTLKENDTATIQKIFGDPAAFRPFAGEKKCGGFHSNYAIGWTTKGQQHASLICFGCGEVRLYGPAGSTLYDMPHELREQLKELFAPYRKNRPPDSSSKN